MLSPPRVLAVVEPLLSLAATPCLVVGVVLKVLLDPPYIDLIASPMCSRSLQIRI